MDPRGRERILLRIALMAPPPWGWHSEWYRIPALRGASYIGVLKLDNSPIDTFQRGLHFGECPDRQFFWFLVRPEMNLLNPGPRKSVARVPVMVRCVNRYVTVQVTIWKHIRCTSRFRVGFDSVPFPADGHAGLL